MFNNEFVLFYNLYIAITIFIMCIVNTPQNSKNLEMLILFHYDLYILKCNHVMYVYM